MSFLWIFFGGHAFSEFFFFFFFFWGGGGSSIILSNFLGFAHFFGNLFISIKIRVAYTYALRFNFVFDHPLWLVSVKFWKLDHDDVVWIANQMESKPS